jgi:hypothetical protein
VLTPGAEQAPAVVLVNHPRAGAGVAASAGRIIGRTTGFSPAKRAPHDIGLIFVLPESSLLPASWITEISAKSGQNEKFTLTHGGSDV